MKQLRHTRQRRLVLDALQGRLDHPTADQLYLELRALEPKISRGTVYRNLKILSEQGEIQHMNIAGVERFDAWAAAHGHLVCVGCGAFSNAPLPYDAALDQQLAEQTGYSAPWHQTVFRGLCPACQKKRKAGNNG